MYSLKKKIQLALEENDLDAVASLAMADRKVISLLVRLAYDKETLVGWRAIKAIGLAAREMVKTDAEFLRETSRKLLWSLSDESGGIGWSAPEMLGEIVAADPKRFSDVIPLIAAAYEVKEEVFRPGVVYAFGRIAETAPELIVPFQKTVVMSLVDANPLVKIFGLELIGRVWDVARSGNSWSVEYQERIRHAVLQLVSDKGEAWAYERSDFINVHVGETASLLAKKLM